ncbi:hypothetical protein DPMN_033164 [Dreissena polymorpha]|uniref:Uncharacterized protein n=1 Tax=Dreissena polymorpha TaxID=45954 RepID=A0A9D4M545_DREPO|nr:hypothetical protein DPMN_033158 [Dreissena polymorpha]KAH3869986.1 hypothetical protein DPMN_033164 [Dreissena polymorpha]
MMDTTSSHLTLYFWFWNLEPTTPWLVTASSGGQNEVMGLARFERLTSCSWRGDGRRQELLKSTDRK